jgi:aminoglycoside/choline kinase family phosphotransferase
MVTPEALVLIDFQDALMGPYAYDLVALLRDSYIHLTPARVDHLVDDYLSRRSDLDAEQFRCAFDQQTVQRKLKDAGRFVYIDRVKGDSRYLQWIEPTLNYVKTALDRRPELEALRSCLCRLDPEAFE